MGTGRKRTGGGLKRGRNGSNDERSSVQTLTCCRRGRAYRPFPFSLSLRGFAQSTLATRMHAAIVLLQS